MKREPEMHVVKRDGKIYMEPVNPPEDRVGKVLKQVQQGLEEINPARQLQASTSYLHELSLEKIRREARMKAEEVAREEAMLGEMAAMRQSVHDANERARLAEERQQQNQANSDARERLMVKLTKASLAIAALGIIMAITAIVVAIIVA